MKLKQWLHALVATLIAFLLAACAGITGTDAELPPVSTAQSVLPEEENQRETSDPEKMERSDLPPPEEARTTTGESGEAEPWKELATDNRAAGTETWLISPAEPEEIESLLPPSDGGTTSAGASNETEQLSISYESCSDTGGVSEDGTYTAKDDVALYLHLYHRLPDNFITKREAESLGWTGGSLEPYAPGKCIGGDWFGNYEQILPVADGRTYRECDIGTLGASNRGAKRIVFSSDGLIYYTDDHYQTFEPLYTNGRE